MCRRVHRGFHADLCRGGRGHDRGRRPRPLDHRRRSRQRSRDRGHGLGARPHLGGHFNPAITLGFLVTRRIQPLLAVGYWISQFGAAAIAALLLWWIFPNDLVDAAKLGGPGLGAGIGTGSGLVLEAIMTFFLVLVVFATAADPRGSFKSIAGLGIGLTITIDVLIGGPLTGAAMNPSRAFGPMLVHDNWSNGWIWYVGPFLGGAVAAFLYEFLYLRPEPRPRPVGPPETGVEEPSPGRAAEM